jgi:hypothetical protein
MSCAPQAADERRSKQAAMFTNDRRDSNYVIDFGRVLETKHESETQYAKDTQRC